MRLSQMLKTAILIFPSAWPVAQIGLGLKDPFSVLVKEIKADRVTYLLQKSIPAAQSNAICLKGGP